VGIFRSKICPISYKVVHVVLVLRPLWFVLPPLFVFVYVKLAVALVVVHERVNSVVDIA
jgi:hypothetical protein